MYVYQINDVAYLARGQNDVIVTALAKLPQFRLAYRDERSSTQPGTNWETTERYNMPIKIC